VCVCVAVCVVADCTVTAWGNEVRVVIESEVYFRVQRDRANDSPNRDPADAVLDMRALPQR
jgi:hypothetical protein